MRRKKVVLPAATLKSPRRKALPPPVPPLRRPLVQQARPLGPRPAIRELPPQERIPARRPPAVPQPRHRAVERGLAVQRRQELGRPVRRTRPQLPQPSQERINRSGPRVLAGSSRLKAFITTMSA